MFDKYALYIGVNNLMSVCRPRAAASVTQVVGLTVEALLPYAHHVIAIDGLHICAHIFYPILQHQALCMCVGLRCSRVDIMHKNMMS